MGNIIYYQMLKNPNICRYSLFIVLIWGLLGSVVNAQVDYKIDSILVQINQIDDSLKYEAYKKLIDTYSTKDYLQAIIICNKAQQYAIDNNNKLKEAEFLYLHGYILYQKEELHTAEEYYEKALLIDATSQDTVLLGDIYFGLGNISNELGYIEIALLYLNKSLKLRQANGSLNNVANTLSVIGSVYLSS